MMHLALAFDLADRFFQPSFNLTCEPAPKHTGEERE